MRKYYVGIDIGGTNTKVAILGRRFAILNKISFPTTLFKTPQRLLTAITDSIFSLLKKRDIGLKEVSGIGVGIAGLVDAEKGVIRNLINIPHWRGLNIKHYFERIFKIPAFVDNDANVMTLAEFYRGAGRGSRNLVCLTLGTGVGGGIVIDRRLYRGSTSSAGEIGHIPINERGPKCNCGGIACIESYIGNRYLIKALIRRIKRERSSLLKKMIDGKYSDLTPELVFKAARRGDKFAIDFWRMVGARLGTMLTGVINLLDLDKVVIGGGIAGAAEYFFPSLQEKIKLNAMEIQGRHVKIVKAKLGKDAGLVGAAVLVSIERDK
ncbi:MAG: ROK family protein [Candidatus Omnitrophica bacterium]|nr:ROK family protein [Candidatus Omnitrophota bacterium]